MTLSHVENSRNGCLSPHVTDGIVCLRPVVANQPSACETRAAGLLFAQAPLTGALEGQGVLGTLRGLQRATPLGAVCWALGSPFIECSALSGSG